MSEQRAEEEIKRLFRFAKDYRQVGEWHKTSQTETITHTLGHHTRESDCLRI